MRICITASSFKVYSQYVIDGIYDFNSTSVNYAKTWTFELQEVPNMFIFNLIGWHKSLAIVVEAMLLVYAICTINT
jgi:hypothetical protein